MYDPEKVRFFSCDFWNGSQAQCDLYQDLSGTDFPVLMNASGLGDPDQYDCGYHYVFVIDSNGIVAYRGSLNLAALELVLDDAVARIDEQEVSVDDVPGATPRLGAPYPNPFNPTTRIPFHVPAALDGATVELAVLDLRGRVLRTLVSSSRAAGDHVVTFDGRDDGGRNLSSGAYLARLRLAGQETMRVMSLVK
jgi:hypothetical protein